MPEKIRFQAHRGVSSECPENTFPAFRRAVAQGYDIIELDPAFTADGVCVVLHDRTVDRTARYPGGGRIEEGKEISRLSYKEASYFDYGIGFSYKYRGTALPTLKEVFEFAAGAGITVKIDNKIENFTDEQKEQIFAMAEESRVRAAFTCKSLEFAAYAAKRAPGAEIHYDGPVNPAALRKLHAAVNKTRLTVWLRYGNAETSWSSLPAADEAKCEEIKKYASLGIWKISEKEEFRRAAYVFGADVIETNGRLKPQNSVGAMFDCHTHSEHSHDGKSSVAEVVRAAGAAGIAGVCVTDHCDLRTGLTEEKMNRIRDSFSDAEAEEWDGTPFVFKGVELGDAIRDPVAAQSVISALPFDQITGSVHSVRDVKCPAGFYKFDFSGYTDEEMHGYLDRYLDDALETVRTRDIDVLAHLGSLVNIFNKKCGRHIDIADHREKLEAILREIISRGIALEVNTSHTDGDIKTFMPGEYVLKLYRKLGGYLITLGSDAHKAEDVSRHFEKLRIILLSHGFENAYYFKGREAIQYSLWL